MKQSVKFLIAIVALLFVYSCNEEEIIVNVESVTINHSTLTMKDGEEVTLVATVLPEDATNKKVIWSSDNTSIASVDNGKVKAHKAGTAVITVKTDDGGIKDKCTVTIIESQNDDNGGSNGNGYVENVSNLSYKMNTPADQFTITWNEVENAVGYKCWYVYKGESETTPIDAIENGDGTWSAGYKSSMYPGTYIVYIQPIPAEGYTVKENTPSSIEIVIPEFEKTGIYYRFMSTSVTPGVEYEDSCYNLGLKYMNIQYKKPERLEVVANNWYIYTTTPVDDIHHLEMWYGLYYDNDKPSIRVYSSTEPGVKQQYLAPDGKLTNGYWKVYYAVPEGHKYIYIEGDTKYDYLSRTGSLICHWPKE